MLSRVFGLDDYLQLQPAVALPIHIVAEGMAILVAMFVFSTIWHTKDKATSWQIHTGLAFLTVGLLDTIHLLTYPGMPGPWTADPRLSAFFWTVTRFMLAVSMMSGLFIPSMERRPAATVYVGLLWIGVFVFTTIYVGRTVLDHLPVYMEENENSFWKMAVEGILILLYGLSGYFYWLRKDEASVNHQGDLIAAGLGLSALTELSFMLFNLPYDTINLSGHLLKIVSYAFFYNAIFISQVQSPFEELARRRAEQRVRTVALMNSSKDGLAFYSGKHGAWMCNTAFGELFGIDEEVINFDNTDLFYRSIKMKIKETEKLLALLQSELSSGSVSPLGPIRLSMQAETNRQVDMYANPVQTNDQRVGWLLIFRDVTKDEEVHRLRSEYFSVATHEIRTPLASIDGYIELAMEPDLEPSERKQFLLQAKANLERLHHLVSNILDLEKLQANPAHARRQCLNIETLLMPQIENYNLLAAKKGLEFHAQIDANLPGIYGDEVRLGQAVSNLLSNAIKYTPSGSCGIKVSAEGKMIAIEVWDTGIGLGPDEKAHLFERFYRAENEVTRRTIGTGLGLSIVKAIAEAHGGRIEATSQSGRGTKFTMHLPGCNCEKSE
nr:MASE3 domain-containing protein [Heliobacterium chlorum]